MIESNDFSGITVEIFPILLSLNKISIHSFSICHNLRKIEIFNDSKLQVFENDAFIYTSIASFRIPYHILTSRKGIFRYFDNLKVAEFDENLEIEEND